LRRKREALWNRTMDLPPVSALNRYVTY